MLIPMLATILDSLGLIGKPRVVCRKALIRALVKVSPYSAIKGVLREAVGQPTERKIFEWYRNVMWQDFVAAQLWRGFHGFVRTSNTDVAYRHNITPADLAFIRANLTVADIREIQASDLNWKQPVITQDDIDYVMARVRSTINYFVFKSRWIETIDQTCTADDRRNDFRCQAMHLIYHYESSRSLEHVINSVKSGLKYFFNDLCDTWTAQKRTAGGHGRRYTGERDADGNEIWETCNTKMQEPLTLMSTDGSESENPGVSQAALGMTSVEENLSVEEFVAFIAKRNPHLGEYLDMAVLNRSHDGLTKWLEERMPPSEGKESPDRYYKMLQRYCNVDQRDINEAMVLCRTFFNRLPGDPIPPPSRIENKAPRLIPANPIIVRKSRA